MQTDTQTTTKTPEQQRKQLRTLIALETEVMIMAARTGSTGQARRAQAKIAEYTDALLTMSQQPEQQRRTA